jgi:hypothetical protein
VIADCDAVLTSSCLPMYCLSLQDKRFLLFNPENLEESFSETSVNIYQIIRRYIAGHSNPYAGLGSVTSS